MENNNETVASVADCIRHLADTLPNGVILNISQCNFTADRIEAAHRREVAELRGALKKAYDTLYSISCSRYGKGLTCTDDIHELVTMARECSDELYENENLRKALEGAKDEGK